MREIHISRILLLLQICGLGAREDHRSRRSAPNPYLRLAEPGNEPPRLPPAARTARHLCEEHIRRAAALLQSAADSNGYDPDLREEQDLRLRRCAHPVVNREGASKQADRRLRAESGVTLTL